MQTCKPTRAALALLLCLITIGCATAPTSTPASNVQVWYNRLDTTNKVYEETLTLAKLAHDSHLIDDAQREQMYVAGKVFEATLTVAKSSLEAYIVYQSPLNLSNIQSAFTSVDAALLTVTNTWHLAQQGRR